MTTTRVLLDMEASKRILALYSDLGTWRAVEAETGINAGLLWQVAHGKCRSNIARVAVGLPPLFAMVTPCPDCGRVHKRLKTCDSKRDDKPRRRFTADATHDDIVALDGYLTRLGLTRRELIAGLGSGRIHLEIDDE